MKPKLQDLWRWNGTLDRGAYLFWGVVLAALKFNLDRWVGALWFDKPFSLFDPAFVQLYFWQTFPTEADRPYFLVLTALSLPFIWTGTVLTLRRLRSISWHPIWVLLFFVPIVKLFLFTVLCLMPSQNQKTERLGAKGAGGSVLEALVPHSPIGSVLASILLTAGVTTLAAWLGMSVLGNYGWSLFVGLPFCMGFLSVLLYSYRRSPGFGQCMLIANGTVLVTGAGMLLFAIEGFICILMAAPIAGAVASLGGTLAYGIQRTFGWQRDSERLYSTVILTIPLCLGLEHAVPPPLPLLEVKTSVIVDAPPEDVWRNVIAFSELEPPGEWLFKIGIAYPVCAEIKGAGVGAVRHCVFSTGPFVEPIEVWDEPRLLKFSVVENPAPMREWTPYRHVHPPHLDGYLESKAGQFALHRLEGDRTLLEGTTWYHHRLWPAKYWQIWSDHIIHTIHRRVLNHVKELSERNHETNHSGRR